MRQVKIRYIDPELKPRRTKLEIPGWSGERAPRADNSREQPWHCLLFSEGAQYGIELLYPFESEFRVSRREGRVIFEGLSEPDPETGLVTPPFRAFGDPYYTYQVLLDIDPGEGFAIRTEPHPRFYTDPTGTVPIAVPALVRNWWPMMYFMVFKSPLEGQTHIFRPGEPFAQIIVIPEDANFDLVDMSEDEAAERELRSMRIHQARSTLAADTHWMSSTQTVFDGTYRHLARAAKART